MITTGVASDKRASLTYKTSIADGRLSEQINPPKKQNTMSTCGQIFLCIIGSLLSASICVWLALFSTDVQWRRMLFAGGAALCAIMFGLLALATYKRQKKLSRPVWEPMSIHRRSISARRATHTGAPHSTRRLSSDIETGQHHKKHSLDDA
uniref:Transmembrane protein n=1 Tax=Panagrellus redivivus TaxID=6233 RepID=A0A7E4ZQT0_PANRE